MVAVGSNPTSSATVAPGTGQLLNDSCSRVTVLDPGGLYELPRSGSSSRRTYRLGYPNVQSARTEPEDLRPMFKQRRGPPATLAGGDNQRTGPGSYAPAQRQAGTTGFTATATL